MSADQPAFLPRPGDLPRDQLVALAERTIRDAGGPTRAEIHFKFTCQWCGVRCTLNQANTLFETGECCVCGKTTKIDLGGFSLHYKL